MYARTSSEDLTRWEAFGQLEPYGNDYFRTGILASITANAHRDPKKRSKAFEPEDFVPSIRSKTPPRSMTQEEMLRKVEELNRYFGGTDMREGKQDG